MWSVVEEAKLEQEEEDKDEDEDEEEEEGDELEIEIEGRVWEQVEEKFDEVVEVEDG